MIINGDFDGIFYGKDVEKELDEYMDLLMDYTDGSPYISETKVRERTVIPDGYNISLGSDAFSRLPDREQREISDFWAEEHRRTIEGHDGMSGLQYQYFNYGRFRGKASFEQVDFRRSDNDLNFLIESCIQGANERYDDNRGWGIIEVGRRRSGKSSKIGNYLNREVRRMENIDIIVTSKTEDDAQRVVLGDKTKFFYQNLPLPLKPTVYKWNEGVVHFGIRTKDEKGNPDIAGRNNKLIGKTPKAEALEGGTLWAWIHDEAPKTPNLTSLKDNTLPALADKEGFDREGFCYIVGVAGDFDKFGEDFIDIWNNAPEDQLIRWFSVGWYSMCADPCGNEDIRDAVKRILTKRHNIWKNKKISEQKRIEKLRTNMQQYPLTVQEAFMSSGAGKFDNDAINDQRKYLEKYPPDFKYGTVKWQVKGVKSKFEPKIGGKFQFLEHPKAPAKYAIGVDTYGLKQADGGSSGVAWVYKLKNNELSPLQRERKEILLREPGITPEEQLEVVLELGDLPVGLYVDRNKDPKVFADNLAALSYYIQRLCGSSEPIKILIETEPSNAIDYLLTNYPHLVMNEPIRPDKEPTWKDLFEKWGLSKKGYWADKILGELAHYFKNFCYRIYFKQVLDHALKYDESNKNRKYDDVDALGISLIIKNDYRIEKWNRYVKPAKEQDRKQVVRFNRR